MLLNIRQKKPELENNPGSRQNSLFSPTDTGENTDCLLAEIIFQNQRGKIFQIESSEPSVAATYEVALKDDNRSITFTLYHLRKWCAALEKKILSAAQAGELLYSDSLLRQRKNINLKFHTHRLKIIVHQKSFDLKWLIDVDFSTSYSYGTSHGRKILKNLIIDVLNEIEQRSDISIEDIGKRDWSELIRAGIEKSLGTSQYNKISVLYRTQTLPIKFTQIKGSIYG